MIDYSAYEYLKIEVAERVATVTLHILKGIWRTT